MHPSTTSAGDKKTVLIYTDGACSGNPGPGGYAALLLSGAYRKEVTGGFQRTTNNRVEMMAVIVGLEALKYPCRVTIFTDSQVVLSYLTIQCITTFKRMSDERLRRKRNGDLKIRLRNAIGQHDICGVKVLAHSGVPENERCDELAVAALRAPGLPEDTVYEPEATGGHQLFAGLND